jgi:hypothetical protein
MNARSETLRERPAARRRSHLTDEAEAGHEGGEEPEEEDEGDDVDGEVHGSGRFWMLNFEFLIEED